MKLVVVFKARFPNIILAMSDIDEKLGFMILSQEEKRYYRALLAWKPSDAEESTKQKVAPERPVAGQFRVLVIGSKGCGKTSILTRVGIYCSLNLEQ